MVSSQANQAGLSSRSRRPVVGPPDARFRHEGIVGTIEAMTGENSRCRDDVGNSISAAVEPHRLQPRPQNPIPTLFKSSFEVLFLLFVQLEVSLCCHSASMPNLRILSIRNALARHRQQSQYAQYPFNHLIEFKK